jgi:tape measure domain-containing protein
VSQNVGTAYVEILPSTRGITKHMQDGFDQTVDSTDSGFSGLFRRVAKWGGIAAATIGGLFSAMVLRGGFARLMDIENAQAKLRGLGHDVENVDLIMANALSSVKGTAFGLGEAATTAANAVAAGIKPGEELERVLRLTADAATIGGTSMSAMGEIFNKVAATGHLTGRELMQLNAQGIPVLKLLADQYGVTAEEAREMVSRGEVDFAAFADAMESGLGGAALSAGDTTAGAFANMQAAMGRFGAVLLEKAFPLFKVFFDQVIQIFDGLSERVGPLMERLDDLFGDRIADALGGLADKVLGFVDAITSGEGAAGGFFAALNPLWALLKGLAPIFPMIGDALAEAGTAIANALLPVLPSLIDAFLAIVEAVLPLIPLLADFLVAAIEALTPVIETLAPLIGDILVSAVEILAPILEALVPIVEAIFEAFEPLIPVIADIAEELLPIFADIVLAVLDALEPLVPVITDLAEDLLPIFADLLVEVLDAFIPLAPVLLEIIEALVPVVEALADLAVDILPLFVDMLNEVLDPLMEMIGPMAEELAPVLETIADLLVDYLVPALVWMIEGFAAVLEIVLPVVAALLGGLVTALAAVIEVIVNVVSAVANFVSTFIDKISSLVHGVGEKWDTLLGWFRDLPGVIGGIFSTASKWLVNAGKNILGGLWNGMKNAWSNVTSWVSGLGSRIRGAVSGAGKWLVGAGKAILSGLWSGMKAQFAPMISWVSSIAAKIKAVKGPEEYDKTLLVPAGQWIMEGFQSSLEDEFADVLRFAGNMAGQVGAAVVGAQAPRMNVNQGALTSSDESPVAFPSQVTLVDADGSILTRARVIAGDVVDGRERASAGMRSTVGRRR